MASKADGNDRKFAEPRSWAGKWCGYALAGREAQPGSGERQEGKFPKPRGWSAKWCGQGLLNGRGR